MADPDITLNDFQHTQAPEYLDASTPKPASLDRAPLMLQTPVTGPADTSPSNAAYETALNVLLSLGARADDTNSTSIATPRPREGVGDYFTAFPNSNFDPSAAFVSPIAELTEQFSTCALLPQDKVVQLLRHYRYNIAPWVSDEASRLLRTICVGSVLTMTIS